MNRPSYRTLSVVLLTAGIGLGVHACKPDSPTAPVDNRAPTASIVSPLNGSSHTAGESIAFAGGATDAEDGSLTGSSLQWESSLDGNIGSGVSFSKSNLSVGTHTIRLIATDSDGASDTATVSIGVSGVSNQLPTASFSFSCSSLTCTFTDGSSDPDGSVVAWAWQFGDGATSNQQNPQHAYAAGGTFNVVLTVTDDGSATDDAMRPVTVTPENQGPVASFKVECDLLECTFTDESTDSDGTIAAWSWTFGDGATSNQQNPAHAYASGGTYQVTLIVTDDDGATGQSARQATPNAKPVAAITAPSQDTTATEGDAVAFAGTGTDPEDGPLSGASLQWESSQDGSIGSGTSFSKSDLTLGVHTIRLIATDSDGAADSATVTVTIEAPANQAPTATITAPSQDTTATEGDAVAFAGTGTDPEDGPLSGASLQWGSSLDGSIGSGTSFSKSDLTVGVHTIRLIATDSDGAADSATVTVTIEAPANQAPTATITAPADGSSFTEGTNVSFRGTGVDPEDGSLSGADLVWTSDIQPGGSFGTGSPTNENGLIVGTHLITLTVTDSEGAKGTAQITVTITSPANQAPTAVLSAPSQDTTATEGDAVAFAGTGSDPEDGPLTGPSLQWESSLDGSIGSGVSFSKSDLTLGVHTIRLIATDGAAAADTATVSVTIEPPPNQAPTANFTSSCLNLVCDFTDTSTDPDGTIAGWAWDFGDGGSSSQQNPQHTYSVGGPYAVTLVASDDQAASDTVSKDISLSSPILAGYQIEVRESPGVTLTESQWIAVDAAVARWESLITDDLVSVPWTAAAGSCGGATTPALDETVDDLVIYLEFVPIDGPFGVLGSAGPCLIRGTGSLPFLGGMRFDTADLDRLETDGRLEDVIVHEMGHVLGIGTLWVLHGLLQDPTEVSPAPINDTWFSGTAAIAAFNSIGGAGYGGGAIVPVENDNTAYGIGSLNGHWRESVFTTELMTPSIGAGASPLSVVTSESLVDLGYTVNSAAADPFTLSFDLLDEEQQPGLPLMGDIWQGPIEIVDSQGRVTGSFRAF